MRIFRPKLDIPLASATLPAPIMFRSAQVPAEGIYPLHQHAWGGFAYAFSGVMELKVAGHHYLAPPQYRVWLPPDLGYGSVSAFITMFKPMAGATQGEFRKGSVGRMGR